MQRPCHATNAVCAERKEWNSLSLQDSLHQASHMLTKLVLGPKSSFIQLRDQFLYVIIIIYSQDIHFTVFGAAFEAAAAAAALHTFPAINDLEAVAAILDFLGARTCK